MLSVAATGCHRECGGTSVLYTLSVWEMSSECYKDYTYKLFRNETSNGPELFLGENLPMFNISIEEGLAFVNVPLAFFCYDDQGAPNKFDQAFTLGYGPFTFSTGNKFTAIGSNNVIIGYISDGDRTSGFVSGCLPMCGKDTSINSLDGLTPESLHCLGEACYQTPIPEGIMTLNITLSSRYNQSEVNTCSYGFLAETDFTLGMTPEKFL